MMKILQSGYNACLLYGENKEDKNCCYEYSVGLNSLSEQSRLQFLDFI